MQVSIVAIVLLVLGLLGLVGALFVGGPASALVAILAIALLLCGVIAEATQ